MIFTFAELVILGLAILYLSEMIRSPNGSNIIANCMLVLSLLSVLAAGIVTALVSP